MVEVDVFMMVCKDRTMSAQNSSEISLDFKCFVLNNYYGIPNDMLRFGKTHFGKPFLKDVKHIEFNVSHSAEYFVMAVGPRNGIDIEANKRSFNFERIVDGIFSEQEKEYIANSFRKDQAFFEIWTAKEEILYEIKQLTDVDVCIEEYLLSELSLSNFIQDQKKIRENLNKDKNIVFLNDFDQNKSTLFLFHPAGGTVFGYQKMFYKNYYLYNIILVAFPMDKYEELKHFSLSNLASYYMEKIQGLIRHKEILLGGYSFGGNLAFEIAHQLNQKGNSNITLLLIDSYPMDAYYVEANDVEITTRAVDTMKKELKINNLLEFSETENLERIWRLNHKMLKKYRINNFVKCNQTLLLICEEKENQEILESLMIQNTPKTMWKQHIDSKVSIEETKGNHYSIFSNGIFAEEVGDRIDRYLLTNVLRERSE